MVVGRVAEALFLTVQSFERSAARSRGDEKPLTVFDSSVVPPVSIESYLRRLHKHFMCGDQCFLAALVYIDRLLGRGKIWSLTARNVHRITLTSLLIATKFLEDSFYSNGYYAKYGGIHLKE